MADNNAHPHLHPAQTHIGPEGIGVTRVIDASPAAVFEAWTKPENFAQWFGGPQVDVPLESLVFTAEQKEQLVAGWQGFLDELATIPRS
ncbi:MAG TPA: SRPBCC domain-containing protein [Candidatus Corynebacterium gallistercoris]|uniref:SRPBCC domain-containing protein n=1 Tax=Candidatus Corynebacterium gallistercoris TaxID=2838530 RepID=A0A9D1RVF0_9CORY|nr:SRPBCC domain-containing protein [Candidatus Corynebacterium gallistercoris]